MRADRTKWEARYRAGDRPHDGPPSGLLRRWLPPVRRARRRGRGTAAAAPSAARALDVATGLGRNALYLAMAGYDVDAVDISHTALREGARRARRAGLRRIRWIAADLDRWRPARGAYDVVVNAFFLDRRLFPALRAAVRPGGLFVFETHLAEENAAHPGAGRAATRGREPSPGRRRRVRRGELRRRLNGWQVLYAKDGICREGGRSLALGRIVARRPDSPHRRRASRFGTAPATRPRPPRRVDRSDSSPESSP